MTPSTTAFTRIVLGLDQRLSDRATLRFAADFARLLRIDLVGLFAEDPSIARVAELPTLREFRLIERQWQQVEGRNLSGDLALCIETARRSFDEIAQATGVSRRFEVVRARMLEAIRSTSEESDIVVMPEPRTATHFAGESFSEAVAAALTTQAAVLVVPRSFAREHGTILAISDTAEDACVASARTIAAAANERLEVIALRDSGLSTAWPSPDRPGERLIVMSHRTDLEPISILSRRRVPVLVLPRGSAASTNARPELPAFHS